MPLNDAGLEAASDGPGLSAAITHISLHTADPGTTGANESTAGRQAVTWDTSDPDGDLALSAALAFTGGAASGACTHFGLWDAVSAGGFYGGGALAGDQSFNASGEYTLDSLTISGTST